jgi:hypothetical protein
VISIITKTGGELEYVQVGYSANIMISGYDSSRVFYSPRHLPDSDPKYNPDIRTTLYWHPDISLQNNKPQVLNYFNADNSSKIRVIAEGITEDGIPVTCRTEYEVR